MNSLYRITIEGVETSLVNGVQHAERFTLHDEFYATSMGEACMFAEQVCEEERKIPVYNSNGFHTTFNVASVEDMGNVDQHGKPFILNH